jgi:hypothetical protein
MFSGREYVSRCGSTRQRKEAKHTVAAGAEDVPDNKLPDEVTPPVKPLAVVVVVDGVPPLVVLPPLAVRGVRPATRAQYPKAPLLPDSKLTMLV